MSHIPPHMTSSYQMNRSNASTPSFQQQQYHQQPPQQQQQQQQQQLPPYGRPVPQFVQQPQLQHIQQPQLQPRLVPTTNTTTMPTNNSALRVNCKVYLPDDEIRRFRVANHELLSFDTIFKKCLSYDGIQPSEAKLYYKDDEGDWIRITNDAEWKECTAATPALTQQSSTKFRVKVTQSIKQSTATTSPITSTSTSTTTTDQKPQQQLKDDFEVAHIFSHEEPATTRNQSALLEDSFSNMKFENVRSRSPSPVEQQQQQPLASNQWEVVPPVTTTTVTPMSPDMHHTYSPQPQYVPSPHTPHTPQVQPSYYQPNIVPATMTQSWFNQQQQQQLPSLSPQQQQQQPYQQQQQQPPVQRDYTLELNNLAGMGFSDKSRNLQLLQKHNGELAKVVAELCGN